MQLKERGEGIICNSHSYEFEFYIPVAVFLIQDINIILQAQARCHRIGQTKEVKVYRLITRNSYEREMFDKASLKLGLDKAVLKSMKNDQNPVSTRISSNQILAPKYQFKCIMVFLWPSFASSRYKCTPKVTCGQIFSLQRSFPSFWCIQSLLTPMTHTYLALI